MTFIDKCVVGLAKPEDIYDYIDMWHKSLDDNGLLSVFIGMTETEYALWVETVKIPYMVRSSDQEYYRFGALNSEQRKVADNEYFIQAIVLSRKRDESVIPKGQNCYGYNVTSGGQTQRIMCPYLVLSLSKDEQNCGYCAFMQKGDWMPDSGISGPGLWDASKACGVKFDLEEPRLD